MKAREVITAFLRARGGFVLYKDIVNHVTESGYKWSTAGTELSRMTKKGFFIREGVNQFSSYMVNPEYTEGRSKDIDLSPKGNGIFDKCRTNSRIYEVDDLLRTVREGGAWGNAATANSH